MEIKTIIYGEEGLAKMEEYKAMSPDIQRYLFYRNEIHGFMTSNRKETDTHIYWCNSNRVPRFENNRLFYLNSNKAGITFDKEKKTISIWFGCSIQTLQSTVILNDVIRFFKLDWFNHMSHSLKTLLNKTMLQNMIKGKLTNPRDYVKAYLKTSPYKNLDLSPELFYKTFMENNHNSPKGLKKYILYVTNPNEGLEHVAKQNSTMYNGQLEDLFSQAEMLDRKVNLKWSETRMKEVHAEWTRELMGMAIKSIEPVDYNYPEIETPEGISLIRTNLELFEEGTVMHHCVYTNYEREVRNKNYYVFRYDREGVRATAGVRVIGPGVIRLDQMYAIRNTSVDEKHKEYVLSWLYSEKPQELFKHGEQHKSVHNLHF